MDMTDVIQGGEKVVLPETTEKAALCPDPPKRTQESAQIRRTHATPPVPKKKKTKASKATEGWRQYAGKGRTRKRCSDELCRAVGIVLTAQRRCPDCGKESLLEVPRD